jgi:hypothetical protein
MAPPPPTRSERSAAEDSAFRLASPAHKRNCRLPLAANTSPQPVRETRSGRDDRRESAVLKGRGLPPWPFPLNEDPQLHPI